MRNTDKSCQRGEEEWTYEYTCGRTCYSHLGKWGLPVKSGDCDTQDENCRVATSGAVDNIECVKRGIKRELTLADWFEKTDATQWDIYGKKGVFVRMGSGVLATKAPGSKAILNFTSKHDPDTRWGQGILTKGARDANVHDFVFASNLTFPVKSKPVNAGLVFRVSNPGHGVDEYKGYYTGIEWAGVGSATRLVLGAAHNNWRHIRAADLGVMTKSSFVIKVEAVGSLIKIFVDDVEKPLIEVHDQTFKRGRVGLRTFKVQVQYSNIEFKRIRD
ncbi:hypothetical protein CDD81_5118 [Ophiocordyceps australis]|uniref:3-keto-disaccharide hydrolase domain-containing protein n=1 Tax=Ophiocordyceps australis TaxID=1399860 RepID=A0A2C5Y8R2_9HYPO|nr:hypothetical protein CDD81_5118 [Ophiocordyceps australis]